jgi:DNA-binding NarL/FixJ family response regulator
MASKIRLLLADDHALVREGLKQLLALTPDIVVIAEAADGDQVLAALRHLRINLILLDLTMPGIAGPDLIATICSQAAPPPILVLSMHNAPQIARRALAAGAAGYLTKDNDPEILVAAIRRVAAGGRFLDPLLAESMAFEAAAPASPQAPHESLSEREAQVLTLLAQGAGVNDIAQHLAISNKTVSTHKARLMEKMGFANNTDLIRYSISHDLTD